MNLSPGIEVTILVGAGQVLIPLVSPIALGVVGGSALETRLLPRLLASTIRGGFVVVLAVVVAQMLYRGVMG
jgi:uncharacterized membrane protein YfcA